VRAGIISGFYELAVMLSEKELVRLSKFLSLILRHNPGAAGISLDEQGWVLVSVLLEKVNAKGFAIDEADLNRLVATNSKKRFAFSEDGLRIRASQGHSVEVELGYAPAEPPGLLYHGTAAHFLDSILEKGLLKMARHHVHLSADPLTAQQVGQRQGRAVVLQVNAGQMQADGFVFYRSANGVWLTDAVLPDYISVAAAIKS
jgi:putative RNA 2'-phosphotransferase